MSDTRICTTCGLKFETSWGSEQHHCSQCAGGTTYAPNGVSDIEVGDSVSHLYFTGEVASIRGRTLNDDPSSVEVRVTQRKAGHIPDRVTIGTSYLDRA